MRRAQEKRQEKQSNCRQEKAGPIEPKCGGVLLATPCPHSFVGFRIFSRVFPKLFVVVRPLAGEPEQKKIMLAETCGVTNVLFFTLFDNSSEVHDFGLKGGFF